VRVWAAASGHQITALIGHDQPVTAVPFNSAFSPSAFKNDDARIVTASPDGTARLWDLYRIYAKANILEEACTQLKMHDAPGPVDLGGVTQYPLTFDRPICVTNPPPPDPQGEPEKAAPAK
jgi:hypothetical protein